MVHSGMSRMGTGRTKLFAVVAVLLMTVSALAFINYGSSDISGSVAPQTSLEATVVYHSYDVIPSTPSVGNSYNYGIYDSGATYYTYNSSTGAYEQVDVNNESAFGTYYVRMNGYYMKASSIGATKTFTYYGTVISTEYNPQVWEFSEERWFAIKSYSLGNTYMFTGWKIATAGTGEGNNFTATSYSSVNYDPGDVILYKNFSEATDSQLTAKKDIYYSTDEFSFTGATDDQIAAKTNLYHMTDGGTTDHWYVNHKVNGKQVYEQVDISNDDKKIHVYATWDTLKHVATNPKQTDNLDWSDCTSKYLNVVLIDGGKKLSEICPCINVPFTIRAVDIDNVSGATLQDHAIYAIPNDLIIDNISMQYRSGKAGNTTGSEKMNIDANSKVFIIGTGINSIKTAGINRSGVYYGQYAGIQGGSVGDNKMIIHSGIYSDIFGYGVSGHTSVTIMNGGVVLETLSGGSQSKGSAKTGDLYLYMTGVTAYSDSYTDYLLNHENDGTKIAGAGGIGNSQLIGESSMVVGGNAVSQADSTHVYLTGTSDVWTIQAAGRERSSSIKGDANMEISGRAIVRNVACGCITDAKTTDDGNTSITGNVNIKVRDDVYIASLVGGGYDTFGQTVGACFQGRERSINIDVEGGNIGYVYGGGLRGPIGTANKPTNININISGGNIVNDVYGGGSGTMVKIKHRETNGDVEPNDAYYDPTGLAYVYGDIKINMTGGVVNGSLYGGGKSVARVYNYGGIEFKIKSGEPRTYMRDNVAMVNGTITVDISGGEVKGNVFGAGKGIDLSKLTNQNAIDSEFSSLYVIRNKTSGSTPVMVDPNLLVKSDVSLSSDLEFAYIPWAKQNLNSTEKVKVTFTSDDTRYREYAKVVGNTNVNISGSCIIDGSVYGGGQVGKLYGDANVHMTGGTVIGTVYGGGLGVVNIVSVTGKRKVTVGANANIKGSIYGGSALGTDCYTTVTYVPGGVSVNIGDILTIGGGEETQYFVVNKLEIGGTPEGVAYETTNGVRFTAGGSDAVIYLKSGTVEGSVFGGGFKGLTYGDTHIFVGPHSLGLKENDVLADGEEASVMTIGGSMYLGGDVGVIESSLDAYKNEMVMGGGELYMAKDPESDNLSFTGSIMGSGNSCLTRGETTIHLKDMTSFATASGESIHRATNVIIDGCVLELNGRATIENTIKNVNNTDYSLYRIEHLILRNGTILVFNGSTNYIYELESQNANGDPTTSTSPLNKVVVGGGNLFILKKIQWNLDSTYTESYGEAKGYTIIAGRSDEYNYGVLAFGSPESEGGFVILKSGSFVKADYSDLSETCRCWYLAGAINNEITSTVTSGGLVEMSVDMPSLQSGSSYRYTGGTFVPDSPGVKDYINTESDDPGSGEFQVRFGNADSTGADTERLVFADDPNNKEKGALMRDDLGEKDPILGSLEGGASVRNPHMIVQVKSNVSEFRYLGYVLICVNEVVAVDVNVIVINAHGETVNIGDEYTVDGVVYNVASVNTNVLETNDHIKFIITNEDNNYVTVVDDPTGNVKVNDTLTVGVTTYTVKKVNTTVLTAPNGVDFITKDSDKISYIVVNTIQTKVHIYSEDSTFQDTSMDISIIGGVGSSTFIVPSGFAGYELAVDSITPVADEYGVIPSGVTAFSMTAVKNMNNTPGWTDNRGTFVLRTDGSVTSTTIGTLQGGYSASILVHVASFTGTKEESYDVAISINDDGVPKKTLTLRLNVSKIDDVSVTFIIDDNTNLKYTYPYGTTITLPDCPPTGEHFVGWYTDAKFNNPFTFTIPITKDLTLYARYMFEVTLDYMDGTTSTVYVNMPKGVIGNMDDPVRPGYDFAGWYEDTEYEHHWNLASDEIIGSKTLYARWVGWDVKVNFVVDFTGSGTTTNINLDASKAQHHTGDLLDCQIMEFGTQFNTSDEFNIPNEGWKNKTLLAWAQYNLEQMSAYKTGGYKFIYWTYQVVDSSGKAVPVYTDSYLTETERLSTDGSGYVKEDDYYVVVLIAKLSKVAVSVNMDSTVIIDGQSVDNLALVDPPSTFLIFPYEESENNWYRMKIGLNGATRPGYSLKGWSIETPTDGSWEFVDSEGVPYDNNTPRVPYEYSAGTEITLYIYKVNDEDYPWKANFIIQDGTQERVKETIRISAAGAARLFGQGDNLTVKFQSAWEMIPYSVSIADPAHGSIIATAIVNGVPTRFTDTSFNYGDMVTLVFTPDTGYDFHHWYSSGEGLFNDEYSASTTFVVRGDTNISAYLTGPQIIRVFIEYEGLYNNGDITESMIPNLYWENNGEKVYFTESVYDEDMDGTNHHTLVQYTGTATLGQHPIYIEGRSFARVYFDGEVYNGYELGMPITSTTSQNVYYIMTSKHLYTMADVLDRTDTEHDSSQNVDFVVTDFGYMEATITKVYNDTENVVIGSTVAGSTGTYDVVAITPDAVESLSSMKKLTIHGDTIYRYGYIEVYSNGVKDHTVSSTCDDIAGVGTGIAGMKEYVLKYYFDIGNEVVPERVDLSTTMTLTLEAGYYEYNYPDDSTRRGYSQASLETINVDGYITNKVLLGTITRAEYTMFIYYGESTPSETGDHATVFKLHYGDNYKAILDNYKSVPETQYTVFAWYLLPGADDIISSEMTITGEPGTIKVYGKYIMSTSYVSIWTRIQSLDGTYVVSNPETVESNGHVYYCVDEKSGYVAKYDIDAVNTVSRSYLERHNYPSSILIENNPLEVEPNTQPGDDNVVIITYYRAIVNVTINDANHRGTTQQYTFGQSVTLVHTADDVRTHYYGWTRAVGGGEPSAITVPVEGYSITIDDVNAGSITLSEVSETRKYSVVLVTSMAEIHQGNNNLGSTVTLSVPYGSSIARSGTYNEILTIQNMDPFALSEYGRYTNYYDMSRGSWVGLPGNDGVTGDLTISYHWEPKTYHIRVVYDNSVTVSGTNGVTPMLFDNVEYIVKYLTTYTMTDEEWVGHAGVKYVITDSENHYATVFYIPDGVDVVKNDTFTHESTTYTVKDINTTIKETGSGIEFVVIDWSNRYVAVTDAHGQTVNINDEITQDGPDDYITVTSGNLNYGAIIRLTLVFTGSYTIDETKSTFINPAGGSYTLYPVKQSSLQDYMIQFFVTGDMEITIVSKWVGEHITFYIQGTGGGEPIVEPSMTLLVGKDEPRYIIITNYEHIDLLEKAGYYFDGWYLNKSFTELPEVVLSDGEYCFKLVGNKSLYARYVPLITYVPSVSGNYELTYDGTEQYVDIVPDISVPLNTSEISYTWEGGSGTSVSITDVNDANGMNGKVINYTFTLKKVYTCELDGVDRYVMSDTTQSYSGSFKLVMNKRPVTVIAGSKTWLYDGVSHDYDHYSTFGVVDGDTLADVTITGSITGNRTGLMYVNNEVIVDDESNPNYSITCYYGSLIVIGTSLPTVTAYVNSNEITLTGDDPITVTRFTVSVNDQLTAGGNDYTVTMINTNVLETAEGVGFIVTQDDVIVIYKPDQVNVGIGTDLTVDDVEYTVTMINLDVKETAEGVGFIVTQDDVIVIEIPDIITVTQGNFSKDIYDSSVTIVIKDVEITATGSSAMTIGSGCEVTLITKGDNVLIGASGYDGIRVVNGAYLTVMGRGSLVVKGNGGSDGDDPNKGGSGIGHVNNTPGCICIDNMVDLSAYGYGKHGYGIGGYGAKVSISDSTITWVQGGHIVYTPEQAADTREGGYLDFEGGSAIGGGSIKIDNSTIEKAIGGTKAAAIGESYHRPTSVVIDGSTLTDIQGGSYSAAIGGSRQHDNDADQIIDIVIDNSVVTAVGGYRGSGIGSGYDTHCGSIQGLCDIQIINNSHITATGGKHGADIGTGLHHANLTGYIDGTVSCILPARDYSDIYYKNTYTLAQDIGYGVVDFTREASGLEVYFYVALNATPMPVLPS